MPAPPATAAAPPPERSNAELARLLARVALQDRQAFEQVYRLTSDYLLGLAWGILNHRDRAEDVLQEAFMNVWYGAAGFNPALASPMTWLINIVRNKSIDKLRSGKTERATTVELDDEAMQLPADDALQPQHLLDDSLVRARIDTCMAGLAAVQRQAIALAYYRGMVHTEIAEALGAPLGTVKAWVRRGVDKLKSCLETAGVGA
ncbi:MAG: sigma-70 family RNA polymerase sigma factor [Burkholderiales bacterium]|nr:sigma-70 family RNA polymerase sigma factor [Burkholderiales bacterium]